MEVLDLDARAARVSTALRGVRPDPEEVAQLVEASVSLEELTDTWLGDARFGDTVRDLHADLLWMRADTRPQFPNRHALEGFTQHQVADSSNEAPLRFVEHIVREGLPYTEILTADFTLTDEVHALMEGQPFDPDGAPWQVSHHVDGRPQAGLLSSTDLWQRWYTNNSGKHRNRANMISRAFLCDEIGALDMPVFPSVDTGDNEAIADALRNDPGCVVCHVSLDPLAAYFWPYEITLLSRSIDKAEEEGCVDSARCYPIRYWDGSRATRYTQYDLPPPGYYGAPGEDFADLAVEIVADPRFASCAVDNAWSFFTQRPADEMPEAFRTGLVAGFVDSDFDYTHLVRTLVLSDPFADANVPPLQLRPEAYDRLLYDLTGFRWMGELSSYGTIPLMQQSKFGMRDLAGGGDHDRVLHPNFSPSPTVLLTWDALTHLAAAHAVTEATVLDPTLTDPDAVTAQLVALAARATGRLVGPDDVLVTQLAALHADALAATGDPEAAWRVCLRGLFMDPLTVTY